MPLSSLCRGAKLLVGTITWALQVAAWSAKIWVLVVAGLSPLLCHNQIPRDQALQNSPQPSWHGTGVGAHKGKPTMLMGLDVYPWLSVPTRGTVGSDEKSWLHTVPACGPVVRRACSYSSYPSNAVCLGLCGASVSPSCSWVLSGHVSSMNY